MKKELKRPLIVILSMLCLLIISLVPVKASEHKVLVGKEITLSFQTITQKNVSWSVQNPSILRLSSTGQTSVSVGDYSQISYNATFVGLTAGTTSITAHDESGNLLASTEVSVENPLYDFKLNYDCLFLSYGESFQLQPIGVPEGVSLIWSADNSDISVSQNGIVSLIFPFGISNITCHTSDGLYSATCTVIGDSPTYYHNIALNIGEYSGLNYTINVHGELPELHGTYSSSNPSVASIDENGVVYAKSAGMTTITAQIGNKILTYSVSVASPVPTQTPLPTSTPTPTATPIPTATPAPTAAPSPTITPKPAHKHVFRQITTKATPTQNGSQVLKCTGCNKIMSKRIIYYPKTIALSYSSFTFNGKEHKPTVSVKDSKGNVIDSENYTVSYSNGCTNAGKYKVVIDFKGKYSGSVTKSFVIKKANQTITASNQKKVLGDKSFSLNAKRRGNGKLGYKSSNPKVATVSSTGKITIKGVGKTKITITAASTTNYNKVTKSITITVNPKGTSFTSIKNNSSKKIVIQWKRNKDVTGYQVRYSTSSSFKGAKSVSANKNSILKTEVSKLNKGKTYFVQIRTYKTVSGTRYYSGWSTTKRIKITK